MLDQYINVICIYTLFTTYYRFIFTNYACIQLDNYSIQYNYMNIIVPEIYNVMYMYIV